MYISGQVCARACVCVFKHVASHRHSWEMTVTSNTRRRKEIFNLGFMWMKASGNRPGNETQTLKIWEKPTARFWVLHCQIPYFLGQIFFICIKKISCSPKWNQLDVQLQLYHKLIYDMIMWFTTIIPPLAEWSCLCVWETADLITGVCAWNHSRQTLWFYWCSFPTPRAINYGTMCF